jgi:hypothetical protein
MSIPLSQLERCTEVCTTVPRPQRPLGTTHRHVLEDNRGQKSPRNIEVDLRHIPSACPATSGLTVARHSCAASIPRPRPTSQSRCHAAAQSMTGAASSSSHQLPNRLASQSDAGQLINCSSHQLFTCSAAALRSSASGSSLLPARKAAAVACHHSYTTITTTINHIASVCAPLSAHREPRLPPSSASISQAPATLPSTTHTSAADAMLGPRPRTSAATPPKSHRGTTVHVANQLRRSYTSAVTPYIGPPPTSTISCDEATHLTHQPQRHTSVRHRA